MMMFSDERRVTSDEWLAMQVGICFTAIGRVVMTVKNAINDTHYSSFVIYYES